MKDIITFCGISSLVGMLIGAVAALISVIWDADFALRLSGTAMVVCGAVFGAALFATNSPLYRD
ncbi:hypothetical protein [Mesorhizobium sp. ESP-6-2]|uniref:hypothetical protein n=1 Tax=Mesorhizobium sp. ESP-6-2 TaxID=2876625 RepID=UPI001CCE4C04|nr:hypothetical protein [Mesorhizobium sp. ESP-6-2]MBZ9807677.1 hypothetical protein [Mesorhizobium sp. ESP-6-2]